MDTKRRSVPFYLLLGSVTALFLYILSPFLFPIFWAAVMAGIFHPLFVRLHRRFRSPDLRAGIVLAAICLLVILPIAIIGSLLITESLALYKALGSDSSRLKQNLLEGVDWLQSRPYLEHLRIDDQALADRLAEGAKTVAQFFASSLTSLTKNTISFLVQLGVMLYALYYFIRDGREFLSMVMRLVPLDGEGKLALERHFINTAKATLKVTLIIGGIQGLLGWMLFVIAGIQGSLIWGALMVFTAIIPAVGCGIVWAPAGVILLITGHLWEGALILVAGTLVISTVDQFLRPVLIGKDVPIHPLLIFLSTIGGLLVFGLSGFVIGPIVASLLLVIWDMYERGSGRTAA